MPDPLKKARTGDPLQISARAWNELLEMLQWFRRQKNQAGGPPASVFDATIGFVKNATGTFMPRFSVLQAGAPIILPTDNENGFAQRVALTGTIPNPPAPTGHFAPAGGAGANRTAIPSPVNFVVTLDACDDGVVSRCVVSGACPVKLFVTKATDNYADAETSTTDALVTGPTGYRIVWMDSGNIDSDGKCWGVVRIGEAAPPLQVAVLVRIDGPSTHDHWYEGHIVIDPVVGTINPTFDPTLTNEGESVLVYNAEESVAPHLLAGGGGGAWTGIVFGSTNETPSRRVVLIDRGIATLTVSTLTPGTTWYQGQVYPGNVDVIGATFDVVRSVDFGAGTVKTITLNVDPRGVVRQINPSF
jgi:hypothetical protein